MLLNQPQRYNIFPINAKNVLKPLFHSKFDVTIQPKRLSHKPHAKPLSR
jgi:hypothetical protein